MENNDSKTKLPLGNGGICYVDTEKLAEGFWEPIIPVLSMAYLYANYFTEEEKEEVLKDLTSKK